VFATRWEFKYRFAIITSFYVIGFFSPWLFLLRDGHRTTAWLWVSFQLARTGIADLGTTTLTVTILALIAAVMGAGLRLWASAYLGAATVNSKQMHAGSVMDAGPFARMRNPLYVGLLLTMLPVSLLMPVSGAAFCITAYLLFAVRLIGAEQVFLTEQIGQPYIDYLRRVPAFFPALRARPSRLQIKPEWFRSLADEFYGIGIAGSWAVLAWRYNAQLLTQAVIISFGVFLLLRAILPPAKRA